MIVLFRRIVRVAILICVSQSAYAQHTHEPDGENDTVRGSETDDPASSSPPPMAAPSALAPTTKGETNAVPTSTKQPRDTKGDGTAIDQAPTESNTESAERAAPAESQTESSTALPSPIQIAADETAEKGQLPESSAGREPGRYLASALRPSPPASVEPAGDASSETDVPSWSVGAGVAFFTYRPISSGTSTIVGSSVNWQPSLIFLVDRRLSARNYLTADLCGSYQRSEEDGESRIETHRGQVGGLIGIRHVFNLGKNVEVSGILAAGVGWSYRKDILDLNSNSGLLLKGVRGLDSGVSNLDQLEIKQTSLYGTVSLGLAFEKELTHGLYLRVASSLVAFNFGRSTYDFPIDEPVSVSFDPNEPNSEALPGDSKRWDIGVGLAFSPSLQIRLAF